jgi:ABC-type polysaccharide/polyol phosphate transport system ATPase subunit
VTPEILLMDEPLAVGDAHFQEKCLARMHEFQSQALTIVVVSHAMDLVENFCHRGLVIDNGHLVDEGPPQAVISRYLELVGHLPEMAV